MYPLHLLIALAEEKEGIVRPVLEKCGCSRMPSSRRPTPAAHAAQDGNMQPGMYLAPPLNTILEHAFDEAIRFQGRIRLHRAPPALHCQRTQRARRPTCSNAPAPLMTPS
jgi:hypothetical protein